MNRPDRHTGMTATKADAKSFDCSTLIRPSHANFFRAVEMAPRLVQGFELADVERIESMWELDDGEAASSGYVIALRYGRRVYLDYYAGPDLRADADDAPTIEEVQVTPLAADQKYPQLEGGGVRWQNDVSELNECLAH